ncbi:MAG TPA: complex I NDUFA9 subunit family protein [Actinomycetota bacterium]
MRLVVVGGTGFIGRHVTRSLLDAGHDVTVLGRHPDAASRIPELAGANAARGDVTDAASLTGTLEGAGGVVMAVTFPNYPMEQRRKGLTFERYEAGGARNLLAEATRAGVERFLYVSGAGADSGSAKSWYRAKGLAEEAIKASGIDYVIIRPSWIYGPGDKSVNKMVSMAKLSPVVPKLGVRPQRIQPLYVGDFAEAVTRAFERDAAWSNTFEIGGPEVMTMTEVIYAIAEVLGKKRVVLPIPLPLAKLGTAPFLALPKPPMTPTGVEFVAQDGLVDMRLTTRLLEVKPVTFRDGLSRYLKP